MWFTVSLLKTELYKDYIIIMHTQKHDWVTYEVWLLWVRNRSTASHWSLPHYHRCPRTAGSGDRLLGRHSPSGEGLGSQWQGLSRLDTIRGLVYLGSFMSGLRSVLPSLNRHIHVVRICTHQRIDLYEKVDGSGFKGEWVNSHLLLVLIHNRHLVDFQNIIAYS